MWDLHLSTLAIFYIGISVFVFLTCVFSLRAFHEVPSRLIFFIKYLKGNGVITVVL